MSGSGGSLDREQRRTRQQVDDRRPGQGGAGEDLEEALVGVHPSCPGKLVDLDAPEELGLERLGSSSVVGRHQSRTTSRPPGATAAHAARSDPDRVRQLVQRVLEVDEVELGVGTACPGIVRGSIRIRASRPASRDVAHRPGDGVRLELDADELVSGNRRATAISHLPPPHATSRTRPPRLSGAARSGSWARPSWKKTAMSWTVTASIARWKRGGRSSIVWPVRKNSGSAA